MTKFSMTLMTLVLAAVAFPQTSQAQVRQNKHAVSSKKVAEKSKALADEAKRARSKKADQRTLIDPNFVKEYAESTCNTLNQSLNDWEKQAQEIRNNSTHAQYVESCVDIHEREKGLSKIANAACKGLLTLEFDIPSLNEGDPKLPKSLDELAEVARYVYSDDVCDALFNTIADWLQTRMTKAAMIDDQAQLDAVRHILHAEMTFAMLLRQGCEINVIGAPVAQ